MTCHRSRFHHAGIVDDAGKQCVLRSRGHDDAAAVGPQQSAVVGDALEDAAVDLHVYEARAAERECEGAACAQYHGTELRADHALIDHVITHKRRVATAGGGDRACVDDAGRGVPAEASRTSREARIVQFECGGHQPADVDLSALAENDSVRVDEKYLAIGSEVAQDLTAVAVENAIHRHGGC